MSYILDALRKAETERDRERAMPPGLHAQSRPLHAGDDDGPFERRAGGLGLGLVALGALVLVALLAWWYLSSDPAAPAAKPPDTPPRAAGMAAVPTAAQGPGAEPAAASASGAGSSSASPPVPAPVASSVVLPQPRPEPAPVRVAPPPPRPTVAAASAKPDVAPKPAASSAGTPAPQASPPPRAQPPAPSAAPTLAQLPEAQRRALPAMQVSGSVYSPEAERRMVIIDGQVLREGQSLQPGLVVERIDPKAVLFQYQGQRFVLPF